MKLFISFKYGSISGDHIKEYVKLFVKSNVKEVRVDKYIRLLSINPISNKKYKQDTLFFYKIEDFLEFYNNENNIFSVEFEFNDSNYDFYVTDKQFLKADFHAVSNETIIKLWRKYDFKKDVISLVYFNHLDSFLEAISFGKTFKSISTPVDNFYPGQLMFFNGLFDRFKGLLPLSEGMECNFHKIELTDDSSDITFKNSSNGLFRFFKSKFSYSSYFDMQKDVFNQIDYVELRKSDSSYIIDMKLQKYSNLRWKSDTLISYYWLNKDGEITPEKYSDSLYIETVKNGEIIKSQFLKNRNELEKIILTHN